MTPHDLHDFADSVLLTWGDEDDFKHFLPRMIELCVQYQRSTCAGLRADALFHRLNFADWRSWTEAEVGAIDQFLEVWFLSTLKSFPSISKLSDVIHVLGSAEKDVSPYLTVWTASTSESAYRHFISEHVELASRNAFAKSSYDRINEWLFSESTINWLLAGAFLHGNMDWIGELFQTIDEIELLSAFKKSGR